MAPVFSPHRRDERARRMHAARARRWTLFIGMAAVVAGIWYLVAANAVVASSYTMSDAEDARDQRLQDVEALRAAIAATASSETLETRARELGFTPVRSPLYLAVPGTTVARR